MEAQLESPYDPQAQAVPISRFRRANRSPLIESNGRVGHLSEVT